MGGDIIVVLCCGGGVIFIFIVLFDVVGLGYGGVVQDVLGDDVIGVLWVFSVEDNFFGWVVFNMILIEFGYQVEFIGCGEDVVGWLVYGVFDVVLMDMVLLGIDGVEVIWWICVMDVLLVWILIIGVFGWSEDEMVLCEVGVDVFLVKFVFLWVLVIVLFEVICCEVVVI